jgi:VTC domain
VIDDGEQRIESPSLSNADDGLGPAFELKFLLDEVLARRIEECVRDRLPLDAHGDASLGGAYRTTTLYLDTVGRDVFHRSTSFKRRKYRLRRYGAEPHVFLERKSKKGDRVRKRRTAIPDEELVLLANALAVTTWTGHWFHRQSLARGLRPSCVIAYERTAYTDISPEGPMRLTIDRRLRGTPAGEWEVVPDDGGLAFLPGQAVLEFKFRTTLPALFKELLAEFRLNPGASSKYRLCLRAWGAPADGKEAADA